MSDNLWRKVKRLIMINILIKIGIILKAHGKESNSSCLLKTVAFSVPTLLSFDNKSLWHCQKQPPRGVLSKKCSKNMQQIYWRTPMPKRTLDSYLSYCFIVWAQNLILHKKLLELLIFNQGIPIPVTYLSKAPSQNFKIKFA